MKAAFFLVLTCALPLCIFAQDSYEGRDHKPANSAATPVSTHASTPPSTSEGIPEGGDCDVDNDMCLKTDAARGFGTRPDLICALVNGSGKCVPKLPLSRVCGNVADGVCGTEPDMLTCADGVCASPGGGLQSLCKTTADCDQNHPDFSVERAKCDEGGDGKRRCLRARLPGIVCRDGEVDSSVRAFENTCQDGSSCVLMDPNNPTSRRVCVRMTNVGLGAKCGELGEFGPDMQTDSCEQVDGQTVRCVRGDGQLVCAAV